MIELSKESFSININKKNPLHLEKSYEDSLYAFKTLLYSSYVTSKENEDDLIRFRKLGLQIVDSFKLLSILNGNTYMKKFIKSYDELVNKLYNTINKYSKFEKLLRNNDYFTPIFISDRYFFNSDLKDTAFDINSEVKRGMNSHNSYLIYNKYLKSYEEGYSLNNIIDISGLFKRLIARDPECRFGYLKERKSRSTDIKHSVDVQDLINRKNFILKQVMSDDSSNNIDSGKFDSINEKLKNVIVLELKINVLDNVLNSLLYDFELEPDVYSLYKIFKIECEELLNEYIKDNLVICDLLNKELNSYICVNDNFNNYYELNSEMSQLRAYYMKNYFAEKANGNVIAQNSFIKYLQNIITDDTELIALEEKRNEIEIGIYAEYLVYLAGQNDKEKALSFDEYSALKYGIKNIDSTLFKNNQSENKYIA